MSNIYIETKPKVTLQITSKNRDIQNELNKKKKTLKMTQQNSQWFLFHL